MAASAEHGSKLLQEIGCTGWTLKPGDVDVFLGTVEAVRECFVGTRGFLLALPDEVDRATALGSTTTTSFEERAGYGTGQTQCNCMLEKSTTCDPARAYLDDDFIQGLTLLRNHGESSFGVNMY